MAVVMNLSSEEEGILEHQSILKKMEKVKREDGSNLFTAASVLSLLIFSIFAFQCTSTYVVMRNEMDNKIFVFWQFILMNLLAYFMAILTYKIMS
jgi:ferrous iron transport protein B